MKFIAAIIATIPLFHFWLHALLAWWRRFPLLLYVWGLGLGIFSVVFFEWIVPSSQIFQPSSSLKILGWLFVLVSLPVALWSIFTLGLKRFFVWEVLQPESVFKTREESGPFRYLPHPAYISYVLAAIGLVLVSGQVFTVALLIYMLIVMPIVIWLEEKELETRFKKPILK